MITYVNTHMLILSMFGKMYSGFNYQMTGTFQVSTIKNNFREIFCGKATNYELMNRRLIQLLWPQFFDGDIRIAHIVSGGRQPRNHFACN